MSFAYRPENHWFSTASWPRRFRHTPGTLPHSVGATRYPPTPIRPDAFSEYELYNIPNWDGYDAEPILPETVQAARSLNRLLPREAPEPHIAPGGDGTIGFEWYLAWENSWILIDVGPGDAINSWQIGQTGEVERMPYTQVSTGAPELVQQIMMRIQWA